MSNSAHLRTQQAKLIAMQSFRDGRLNLDELERVMKLLDSPEPGYEWQAQAQNPNQRVQH